MRITSFNSLIETIEQTHHSFLAQSVKAVNTGLTLRNWLIGFYAEYLTFVAASGAGGVEASIFNIKIIRLHGKIGWIVACY